MDPYRLLKRFEGTKSEFVPTRNVGLDLSAVVPCFLLNHEVESINKYDINTIRQWKVIEGAFNLKNDEK
jgi:hypothetical protein